MIRKMQWLQLAAGVAMLAFPVAARADVVTSEAPAAAREDLVLFQDLPTVYGASKYEQKVTEAPSSVSIITSSEIKKYGYRTIADILRSVRSFYITYDRDYSYVGVRGFGPPGDYNSRILLLIDGHRANDNYYDGALVGTEGVIDVDLIDRVEVIRGPGSSLYGNNAFFAVINVITKRGRDFKGTEASAEAGSFQTYKGRVSYGDKFQNGVEALISTTGYDSRGDNLYFREFDPASYPTDSRATNGGHTNTDFDHYQSTFTRLSKGDYTLEGAYSTRTKGVPTGIYGTDFNNPENKTIDQRGYLDLRSEKSLGARTDLTARVYYDYYHYTGYYPAAGVMNETLTDCEWWGGELKLITRATDAQRLVLGAEYTDNARKDHKNFDVAPYAVYDDSDRRSEIWAVYAQDEISMTERFMINAGARYDHYTTFGGTVNPRLALIYSPREKTAIKFLYGSAFHAPNDYDMFDSTDTQKANPDLKPEKIKTYSVVYEQYPAEHFHLVATGFYYAITGLIVPADYAPGVTISKNIDNVTAQGVELELENKWANGVEGRVSYTLQRAEDTTTNQLLTNSPAQLFKLNMISPVLHDAVFAGIEEQCTDKRKTLAGGSVGAYCISNLTLHAPAVAPRLDVAVTVYNLFDASYSDPSSEGPNPPFVTVDAIKQDGRTYRMKVTYAF
jgi:outer membrane receptor for ferrienterochelin and colicins